MVIVDDIDSRIQYTGPWFADKGSQDSLGEFGPPFRSTLHGTQASASIEFAYHGATVQVYGTGNIHRDSGNIHNDSGVIDPTWECFVDGILIDPSPFVPDVNNWLFCAQPTVLDGQHILTVNATVVGNQTFWFDEIRYAPSTTAPLDQEFILVDNADPQLQYGKGWQESYTNKTGSIFTFDFIGISISWYGSTTLLGIPSSATYSIDGHTPIDFVLKGTIGFNQKFFETAQLPAGSHTLKVVYQGNNSTPLNLDYFVVQNGTLPSSATTVSSHATSTTSRNGVSGSASGNGSIRVGAIVGSVIGGLTLIVLGLLLLRRYKRRAAEEKVLSSTPWPFYFDYTTLHLSSTTPNYSSTIRKHSLPPLPTSRPSSLPLLSRAERKAEGRMVASESQRRVPAMVSMRSNATRSPRNVVVHEDSGIRMPESTPATNEIMEVPPLYTVE